MHTLSVEREIACLQEAVYGLELKQDNNTIHEFFAATASGCERVLCEELRELHFQSVRLNLGGGIPFRGTWRDGWRACLQSRIAQRIQKVMKRFPCPDADSLYDGVNSLDWSPFITPRQTISVKAVCVSSQIDHSGFAALKVKDAIVDQIRESAGKRPSVAGDDPDVRVFLYLANDKATVYLDLSGTPLHMRGYRQESGDAPLREPLAAALLRMAEWDMQTPLIDPMCGSGTIPIEAAMRAANLAPGLGRERFGFQRWADFDKEAESELRSLCGELRRSCKDRSVRIQGMDKDASVLEKAKRNARKAGVRIAFKQQAVSDLHPDGKRRIIVTNPPYGVRLSKANSLVKNTIDRFTKLHGWRICILTEKEDDQFESTMPVPLTRKSTVFNGALECKFLIYDIP